MIYCRRFLTSVVRASARFCRYQLRNVSTVSLVETVRSEKIALVLDTRDKSMENFRSTVPVATVVIAVGLPLLAQIRVSRAIFFFLFFFSF